MGRLRDGYENPLFQHYSTEMVDLFGTDEVILYRFDEKMSDDNSDPLWDEYSPKPKYRPFKIKAFRTMPESDSPTNSPQGRNVETTTTVTVARGHLDMAGVPSDVDGVQVRPGDIFLFFEKGDALYFDVIKSNYRGYVNNTDARTFVECECLRKDKFTAERKLP